MAPETETELAQPWYGTSTDRNRLMSRKLEPYHTPSCLIAPCTEYGAATSLYIWYWSRQDGLSCEPISRLLGLRGRDKLPNAVLSSVSAAVIERVDVLVFVT